MTILVPAEKEEQTPLQHNCSYPKKNLLQAYLLERGTGTMLFRLFPYSTSSTQPFLELGLLSAILELLFATGTRAAHCLAIRTSIIDQQERGGSREPRKVSKVLRVRL